MKNLLTWIIALLLSLSAIPVAPNESERPFPHRAEFAADFKRDFPDCEFELRTAQEITTELLVSRIDWDEYLVCVTTGTVLDAEGNGREDLPAPYNYINYHYLPFETNSGDRIVTYLVYEIHSDGEDDFIARYDYPLN